MHNLSTYEFRNVVTHGLGFVLCVLSIPFLFTSAYDTGNLAVMVGVISFSIGLLSVYTTSTIFHYVIKEDLKFKWQVADHIAIYLLIGGTYSAFVLNYANEAFGWSFLTVHWLIITIGIIMKIWFWDTMQKISIVFYVLLGWMFLPVYSSLFQGMSSEILMWLALGGLAYMVGVIFYAWKKYEINHTIWHLFVMLGSGLHFIGIYQAIT